MAARNKSNMKLNVDSALALMQEIYNDIVEQKNVASLITKKMYKFLKDPEDMTVIGPVIKDQQKILIYCTDKKLMLVKLQTALLKQTNGEGATGSNLNLSADERELIKDLIRDTNVELPDNTGIESYQ